jgi:hypothetical protein
MLKLKLELVIVPRRGNVVLKTGIRVFDKRSYFSAYSAIVNGCLGRHSKSSFYLTGLVTREGNGLVEMRERLELNLESSTPTGERGIGWYLNEARKGNVEVPEDPELGEWDVIFHPFFRKVEGDLYLFLTHRVRRLMGITHRDVDFHVFMQNYGTHLPILP